MKKEIKLLDFKDKLPLTFSLVQFDSAFQHMHSYAELVIVLDGQFNITIGDEKFEAKEDDIFIINRKVFHSSTAEGTATVLSLLINQKGFGLTEEEVSSHVFNLNTMKYGRSDRADEIRYLVYSIIKYNTMDNVDSIYTNRAIAYSMFAQLINKFSVDVSQSMNKSNEGDIYSDLASFINDHYKERLTLTSLADHFQYSLSYLSRLFKQCFHVTFMEYYTSVRVNYSLDDLVSTNKTIEEIALEHGFDDPRSYVRAFRSVYHDVYPSEYRRKNRNTRKTSIDLNAISSKFLNLILKKYDEFLSKMNRKSIEKVYKEEVINVDFSTSGKEIRNVGNRILDVGSSKVMVYSELRGLISDLQSHAGFQYLLLQDLFNQTVRLFVEDSKGSFSFSESILENLLSFCKRNYFKPYFRFEYDFVMKPSAFCQVIQSMVSYIKSHYDPADYHDWMFSVSYAQSIMNRRQEDVDGFFECVVNIHDCIRKSLPGTILVSPAFLRSDIHNGTILKRFFEVSNENSLSFHYLSFRYLNVDKIDYIQKDRKELSMFLEELGRDYGVNDDKVLIDCLNFTNQENYLNDTVYASSYLSYNLIHNIENISAMSKDAFFDSYGYEIQKNPFVGKSGLVTYDGIKKASYNAFIFFSRLGSHLLKKGKNFIVTCKGNKIIILLNNFVQYLDLYSDKEFKTLREDERYSCFPETKDLLFHFSFENLDCTGARIKKSSISRHSGSAYDLSLKVGSFDDMKREEVEEIRGLNYIFFSVKKEKVVDNRLNLDFAVEPLETQLIEIELAKI